MGTNELRLYVIALAVGNAAVCGLLLALVGSPSWVSSFCLGNSIFTVDVILVAFLAKVLVMMAADAPQWEGKWWRPLVLFLAFGKFLILAGLLYYVVAEIMAPPVPMAIGALSALVVAVGTALGLKVWQNFS